MTPAEKPSRPNDKYSNDAYPYVEEGSNVNNIYQEERDRYNFRCSERLETALDHVRRRQISRQKTLPLNGYSLHQQLRTAPLDMYVTNMKIKLPPSGGWVRVERCRFNPRNSSLETRLLFNDLTIMGKVNLFNEGELQREPIAPLPEDSCNMILRLRKAGIGFHTEPIRREKGQFNVRTNSHFVEPGFISVYAYGCEPRLREHKRQFRDDIDDEPDEGLSKEMEDIFLKGPLTTTEVQEIADNVNLDDSHLDLSLFPDRDDDRDEWDEPRNLDEKEIIIESGEERGDDHAEISDISDDDSNDDMLLATGLLKMSNTANSIPKKTGKTERKYILHHNLLNINPLCKIF
ncbi:unnamed protein product [Diabrotica balteata]|uniref:Uncharacterized protein n=1 Tax=Diabrotica balteata TaxID=107213 RepID=A0A9N9XAI3_DIABA|nr:unnamed protein product [Diabrotica balteata]